MLNPHKYGYVLYKRQNDPSMFVHAVFNLTFTFKPEKYITKKWKLLI